MTDTSASLNPSCANPELKIGSEFDRSGSSD